MAGAAAGRLADRDAADDRGPGPRRPPLAGRRGTGRGRGLRPVRRAGPDRTVPGHRLPDRRRGHVAGAHRRRRGAARQRAAPGASPELTRAPHEAVGAAHLSGDGRRHESPGVRLSHRLGTSAAVLLIVAGCGSATGAAPEITGEWELVEFAHGGTVVPEPVGGRATLTVADGELTGTSFCNSYSGSYRLDGDQLAVSGLGGTEMGCAPELMDAESAYLTALGAVEQAAATDGYLVLSGADAELRYRPMPTV